MTDRQAQAAMEREFIVITRPRKSDRPGRFRAIDGYPQSVCGGYETQGAARRRAKALSAEHRGEFECPQWCREFRVMRADRYTGRRNGRQPGERKYREAAWQDAGGHFCRGGVPAFVAVAHYRGGVETDC